MKTFIDITLIMNGAFGFICSIIVLFSLKSNRYVNIYLAILMFSISIKMVVRGYLELTDHFDVILNISRNNLFLFLIAFPYLYFKNLFEKNPKFNFKTLLHFVFPLLLIVINKIDFIKTIFGLNKQNVFIVLVLILFFYYTLKIFNLLKVNIWDKSKALFSTDQKSRELKKWTTLLFASFILIEVRLTVSLILSSQVGFVSDNIFFWINSVIWFFIFMKIITNPVLLHGYYNFISKENELESKNNILSNNWSSSALTEITNKQDLQLSLNLSKNIEVIFKQIDAALLENNFFRVSGFSIIDLANKLNIPKSHLAQVFKYHSKLSFSDFKKKVRINDCINLVQSNYLKQNTFESLAKEVGFATYNTFFISFKEVTGKAPNQYISDLQTTKK